MKLMMGILRALDEDVDMPIIPGLDTLDTEAGEDGDEEVLKANQCENCVKTVGMKLMLKKSHSLCFVLQ